MLLMIMTTGRRYSMACKEVVGYRVQDFLRGLAFSRAMGFRIRMASAEHGRCWGMIKH